MSDKPPPPKRTYIRWSVGVVAALVLVVLAVQASGRSAREPAPDPGEQAAQPSSDSEESSAPPAALRPAPGQLSIPTTGPGVTTPGAVVVARSGAGVATVEVEESIVLPADVSQVSLSVLPADGAIEGAGQPRVVGLQAASGDRLVAVPRSTFVASDGAQKLQVDGRRLTLRYTLADVVGRTPNSLPGRSLAAMRPLTANQLGEANVVYYFYGDVSNIHCPDQPADRQMCGMEQQGRWRTVPVAAARSRALVQFDQELTPQEAAPSGTQDDPEDAGATS